MPRDVMGAGKTVAVLAALSSLAALSAGCADPPASGAVVAGWQVGDAWEYAVLADGEAGTETRTVMARQQVPWGSGTRDALLVLAESSRLPTTPAVDFFSGPGASLGRIWLGPEVRTEELWASECPRWPLHLGPGTSSADCRNRLQVMEQGTGETQAMVLERLGISFTIGGPETVSTPAGDFRAVPIAVEFRSDAGDAALGRAPAMLWYAREACGIVREQAGETVRELRAFRCAASGEASGVPTPPRHATAVAAAQAAFGADPVFATCAVPYTGIGLGPLEVDPLGLDCPLPHGLAGRALAAAETLQVEVTWEERTIPTADVHVTAGGRTAAGNQEPVVLSVPAAEVFDPEAFRASVHADGPAAFDEFRVVFRLVAPPAAGGWPA